MFNNSSSIVIPSDLTPTEQWFQYALFYIGFGIVGFIGNLAMGIAITRCQELRSRFFIVVRFLIFVRITIAFQFIVTGTYRALKKLQLVDMYQTRLTCHVLHLFISVSFTVELSLMLVLVIDRMMAMMAPLIYRRLSKRQAKITCICVILGVGLCAKMIPSFLGWDFNEIVPCLNAYSAPSPAVNAYNQNTDFPVIILILVLYSVLWIFVKIRVGALMRENNSDKILQLQRQMSVLPVLRNVVLAHAAVTLIAKLLVTLITFFPEQSIRLTAYSGNLNTVDLLVNVAVLLCTRPDLRRATFCAYGNSAEQGGSSNVGLFLPNGTSSTPAIDQQSQGIHPLGHRNVNANSHIHMLSVHRR